LKKSESFLQLSLRILIDYTKRLEVKMFWKFMELLKEFTVMNVENNLIQTFYSHSNEISHTATADECSDQM
jgi:hypothetical protein